MINVFSVPPEHQAALVRLLIDVTERCTSRAAGFVSSEIHASLDGTRVVNYARWASREAHEAIFEDRDFVAELDRMKASMSFAKADPHLYVVERRIAPSR